MVADDTDVMVSGALFHAFAHACVNLELLIGDELPGFLDSVDHQGFDTAARFAEVLDLIRGRFVDPGPILERVGEEMMRGWYELGPGKELIARGVDFLRFQASSEGYRSVVVGPAKAVGRFDLEHIDEAAGTATIYAETQFPPELDLGVLRGGMMLPGDMIHVEVTLRPDAKHIDVRFVALDHARGQGHAQTELEIMSWRLRELEAQRERDHEFWMATNKTLERAMSSLRDKEQELRSKNAELEANYAALQRSRDELLRMNQRAEQMFSAFAEILPGAVLGGKYEVQGKLGAGGFGVVFQGRDLNLERDVAIKIFKTPADGFGPVTMERFRREGASACRVNHPNAVSIYDSGISVGGVPYLVMELLEGLTLFELLEQGRQFSPATVIELLRPVCDVLASVHAVGVIHRDIKPANLFLDSARPELRVKVLDFGIAKLLDEPERGELTKTGSILGTPIYIAPERLRGLAYDGRADIYSLGVVAYRMLAGASPFSATDSHWAGLLESLTSPVPALGLVAPRVPAAVADLVMRMLAGDPGERPSAAELGAELDGVRAGLGELGRLRELVEARRRELSELSLRAGLEQTPLAGETLGSLDFGPGCLDR